MRLTALGIGIACAATGLSGCGGEHRPPAPAAQTARPAPTPTATPRPQRSKRITYRFIRRPLLAIDRWGISAYVRLNHPLPIVRSHAVLDIQWAHSQKLLDGFKGNCYGSSVDDDVEFSSWPVPGTVYTVRLHLPHGRFLRARVPVIKSKPPEVRKAPGATFVTPDNPYLIALGCPPLR